MLHPIPCLSKADDIAKVIDTFLHYKVNAIPVVDNDHIIGEMRILSILEKLAEMGLSKITLDQLELKFSTVPSQKSISTARKKLKEDQVDSLPVEEEGKIIQVITSNDIVSILNPPQRVGTRGTVGKTKLRSLEQQISNMGERNFPRCTESDSLESAINIMLKRDMRYCVIDSSHTKQSFVTAHDIIQLFYKKTKKRIPIYVVGDKNSRISRMSLSKLDSPLEMFSKSVEEILEARISIKEQSTAGLETKFHQKLLLITPTRQMAFSSKTWSIDEGLANFSEMMSTKVSSKKRRTKKSIRKTSKSEILVKLNPK